MNDLIPRGRRSLGGKIEGARARPRVLCDYEAVYNRALDEFMAGFEQAARPGFERIRRAV
jgi:hypothetical protein